MNKYYHEFSIGFNFWYVLVPALFFVIFAVGFLSVRMAKDKKNGLYYAKQHNIGFVPVVGAIITMVLVFVESNAGIIQFFDNHSDAVTDPVYSLFGCIFVIATMGVAFFGLSSLMMRAAQYAHRSAIIADVERKNNCIALRREAEEEYQERLKELTDILREAGVDDADGVDETDEK